MADLNLPYKTTFAAQIRAIQPSEDEIKEAKASLTDLKGLLPPDINPDDNPQLLFIAANLYVAGMVNLNDDGVDIDTSLAGYQGFERQQLNIEHDRSRIAGYIVHAGLSEYGTDRLITADEARAAGKPFNVAVVAALWKVANPRLCDFLSEASNPLHPDYKALSLSFEVGYSSYNIGVIDSKDRVISAAKRIVRPEDPDYQAMSKRLRAFGGTGKEGSDGLYQILAGSFMPLGGGIVSMPAAAVKGITAITEPVVPQDDEMDDNDEDDAVDQGANPVSNDKGMQSEESLRAAKQEQQDYADLRVKLSGLIALMDNISLSHTTSVKTRVSSITSQSTNPMKSLQEIKEKMASVQSIDDAKQALAGIYEIAEALSKASEEMSTKLEEEKNRSAEIEKNRAAAAASAEELTKQLAAVNEEVKSIKDAQVAAAAADAFNERMAQVEELFDLSDEDRTFVAEEIKDLNDESFNQWMAKNQKSIRKEKLKSVKQKALEDKMKAANELAAALKNHGVEIDEAGVIKEAIASAKANNVSSSVSNNIDVPESLREMVAKEFAESMTIGGKKISEFTKN